MTRCLNSLLGFSLRRRRQSGESRTCEEVSNIPQRQYMWILVPNKISPTYEWKIKPVDLETNP
jgi:hypothetical protein